MDEVKILSLNDAQNKAYLALHKFLLNDKTYNFLLLGPAGTGKTTVIVNVFNESSFKIAFCAFTNKATQVLRNIASKFSVNFKAEFMTIHKLLLLEPKYLDSEFELSFSFDKNKIESLKDYDVIIFDECSTISAQLFQFIQEAWEYILFKHDKKLKFIFLGDFWQLPPVGEEKSVLFDIATASKWRVSKLTKVMRSANEDLNSVNANLIEWIDKFRNNNISNFVKKYPFNLVPNTDGRYINSYDITENYLDTWRNKTPDLVILTYSRANCEKINFSIQDEIDSEAGRPIPDHRVITKFYAGDRCCLDKPIDLFEIKEIIEPLKSSYKSPFDLDNMLVELNLSKSTLEKTLVSETPSTLEQESISEPKLRHMHLDEALYETLYNGELFDILETEDIYIHTALNRFQYLPKYFEAQLLKIQRINDITKTYEIIHIAPEILKDARQKIKMRERRLVYLSTMSDFIKRYPKLDYGYCITIYKSQGSEWNTVYVNLNSIKWSLIGKEITDIPFEKMKLLFKTTYTALSRASHVLKCIWSK